MMLRAARRGAVAVAGVLALSGALAACGGADDGATGDSGTLASDPGSQTFGPECGRLPSDPTSAGSFESMQRVPVGTAAAHDPLLTRLAGVARDTDLLGTLNDTSKQYTVFAPYDAAFDALPKATLQRLVSGAAKSGPSSQLGRIVLHHVLGEQLGPDAVDGEQTTAAGDTLTISGDPQSGMTVSDGTVTAHVVCGNISTGNATVYVIDSVLTGLS